MGFELTILVVISTDCTGSCKFNYHAIMPRRARLKIHVYAGWNFGLQRKKLHTKQTYNKHTKQTYNKKNEPSAKTEGAIKNGQPRETNNIGH